MHASKAVKKVVKNAIPGKNLEYKKKLEQFKNDGNSYENYDVDWLRIYNYIGVMGLKWNKFLSKTRTPEEVRLALSNIEGKINLERIESAIIDNDVDII